jgi:hypothetical protein
MLGGSHGSRQLHVENIFNDDWGTTMSSDPEIEKAKLQSLDKRFKWRHDKPKS